MASSQPPDTTLRYRLAPDENARTALDATFADYHRMMDMLDTIATEKNIGANLVALHGHAYDAIRKSTRLPSRLVTLGLRDRANYRAAPMRRLPLDERLVNVKNASTVSLGTTHGRFTIPFDVVGYAKGWGHSAPAHLVRNDDESFEIHFGVTPNTLPEKENVMIAELTPATPDTILSRAGRLIAGIAYGAIEKAEDNNKVAVVKQAIREIELAEKEARDALAQARAEEYRLNARRGEIDREMSDLAGKIKTAIGDKRDDLAAAGIARQMDLEAQFEVLSKAFDENSEKIDITLTTLRAILSSLQDAEARLAALEASERQQSTIALQGGSPIADSVAKAARAGRAVTRATGVPEGIAPSRDIDELSKLHRDKEIASRLAKLKAEG